MTTHNFTASSLDGFVATSDHSLDWLLKQDFDPRGPMAPELFLANVGALAMGAATYEWILSNHDGWAYSPPTWVFTHRDLPVRQGADVRFVQGEVTKVHTEMSAAAGEKDLWIVGGGDLAGQFADAGLLDEVWVQFAPVTLGAGAPLLPRELSLEFVELARNRALLCTRYRVLAEPA